MFIKKMFYVVKFILLFAFAFHIFTSCSSLAESKTSEKKDMIVALRKAFSPNNDGILDKQTFKLRVNSSSSNPVASWVLDIKDQKDVVVFNKQGKSVPAQEITWNGKDNNNADILDGEYKAYLQVNYKDRSNITDKTEIFFVDTIAPIIQVKADKEFFTPDNDGIDDIMYFNFISAEDLSGIKKWKMSVHNPDDDKEFSSISGDGIPSDTYYWNGKSNDDLILVESVTDYPMKLYSEDFAGNKSTIKLLPVTIGILIYKIDADKLKIRISNIRFKPNTAVMTDDAKNIAILNILADALKKYPDYKIVIEGYANKWKKGLSEKTAYELSTGRAEAIVKELVNRGVNSENLLIKGKGFENPIVALKIDMTLAEKEKMKINRRVEFYMQK